MVSRRNLATFAIAFVAFLSIILTHRQFIEPAIIPGRHTPIISDIIFLALMSWVLIRVEKPL